MLDEWKKSSGKKAPFLIATIAKSGLIIQLKHRLQSRYLPNFLSLLSHSAHACSIHPYRGPDVIGVGSAV
jgi:hypothetical protein